MEAPQVRSNSPLVRNLRLQTRPEICNSETEFDKDGARGTDFNNCSPTRPRLLQRRCGPAPKHTNLQRSLSEEAGDSETLHKVKISEDSSAEESLMVFVQENIGSGTVGGEAQRGKHPAEWKRKERSSIIKLLAGNSFPKSGGVLEKYPFHPKFVFLQLLCS